MKTSAPSSRTGRLTLLLCLSVLTVPEAYPAGQFRDLVERDIRILGSLSGCAEGYRETIAGETIRYERLNPQFPVALLARASNGASSIEWKSGSTQRAGSGPEAAFVVVAGIYSQAEEARKFRLLVNDVPRFVFQTAQADSWSVAGTEGGVLRFQGALRDQYNDVFGYLKISLPSAWVNAGEPVRFKVTGENAGSRAWFMVFQDTAVMDGLSEKVGNESYCEISIETGGSTNEARVVASSSWTGRQLKCIAGGRQVGVRLQPAGREAAAAFTFGGGPGPVSFLIDGEPIAEIKDLSGESSESRMYARKIVDLRVTHPSGARTLIQYQSAYAPLSGKSLLALSAANSGSGALQLVSSSHQDIAWMDTPEQCVRDRDEKVITPALALISRDPSFKFDLEDVLCLREYLERHSGRKDEIGRLLKEGRLGVGASFNEPYEDLFSGEMLAHEFYAGRKWFLRNFPGCDTRTAWNPDVPGRSLQAPQVMYRAGVRYLVLSRQSPGLFRWLSPDGTGVLVFSPGHYASFMEQTAGKPFSTSAGYLASFARLWSGMTTGGSAHVPVLSMSDMSAPVDYGEFVSRWNSLTSVSSAGGTTLPLHLPQLHYSTAEQFMDSAAAEGRHTGVVSGERPNIWLYIHGPTHHRAVSAKREADDILPAAETFSTIDALLTGSFSAYPGGRFTEAWESQIYPDHGWGGKNGDVTDSTFLAKYEHARDIAREEYGRATASIAARVHRLQGKGIPLVIFNGLSWKRSGPVRCTCTFPRAFGRGIALFSASGRRIPLQVLSSSHHADGSLSSADLLFVAENVPAVGYATCYVRPAGANGVFGAEARPPGDTLESPLYRVTLGRGGISQIYDKEIGAALLETGGFLGGELFTMQSVGEDAGEWAEPQQPTMEGFDRLAAHAPRWRLIESGPVRETVELRQGIDHVTVVQRVSLYHSLKQIDLETSLLGWDGTKYREFRIAFPVRMHDGQVAYEVPFGTLEVGKDEMKGAPGERYVQDAAAIHPRSIQHWIGISDRRIGITIGSSVAVWDYRDPTGLARGATLLQPLLLASRRSCNGEGNWYLQKGDHHFRFSLTSHPPGWRNGMRFGAANMPMTAVFNPPAARGASLPETASFLSLGADNVLLSTMKKADDGDRVVVRAYEAEGKEAGTTVRLRWPAQAADLTNIIEEEGAAASIRDGGVRVTFGPHVIQTMSIVPKLK